MMVLVLNSGSSSIKYQLMDTQNKSTLCRGLIERIGLAEGILTHQVEGRDKYRENRPFPGHVEGIQRVLDLLVDPQQGVLADLKAIDAVGHRVVHGGEKLTDSCLLNGDTIPLVEEASALAPLHNPANLTGVRAVEALLPGIPNVAVFDTAFHATMPARSYIYPLAWDCYEKHRIRRFGFHGTSHQYVSRRAAEILGREEKGFRCITCHLGNGVSLTAVRDGHSVDTTLGFGTMCGVPMGTRSGDFDPAVVLHLIDHLGMSTREVHDLIYKESGLKGLSGISSDMRDVEQAAEGGNERAGLALDIYAHGARKYVAALATTLEGPLDAVVFTAGVGENGAEMREKICSGLEVLGVHLDAVKNRVRGKEAVVSRDDSPVKVLVVPTNEELMIALETERIVRSSQN